MNRSTNPVEEKMKGLEDRILSLESSLTTGTTTTNNLQDYQKHILGKLKTIREALVAGDTNGGNNTVQTQAIVQERDQLKEENKKLKVEIDRLNYRVRHLVKALNAEEEKNRHMTNK